MYKIALTLVLVLSPILCTPLFGQCGGRDVSGRWDLLIGDFKQPVRLTLTQSGNTVTGTASESANGPYLDFEEIVVKGELAGDKISLTVDRKNSQRLQSSPSFTESFEGTFDQDGKITGRARVFTFAGIVTVDWASSRPMRCLHKAVTKLGTKHSEPAEGAVRTPWLVADPAVAPLMAGQTTGITTLNWDAGKDHPYAEVWVKVDGGQERKIIELGKGTIQQPIIAGRTYTFILTDAGTTLSTVTVKARK